MAEQTLDEQIIALTNEGNDKDTVAEKLEVTPQKVTAVMSKHNKALAVKETPSGCVVMKAEAYMAYSKANGRTQFGGEKGKLVDATIEELRALINSNWTPELCMEKWQMNEEELQQLVWKLSKAELRDKPIVCNFKQNFFR